MKRLPDEIVRFFRDQGFVIVSTIDKRGAPHNSCKGIINISPAGKVYLLDVYLKDTYNNLKTNPNISITAVNEHKFKGYCLKGKARLINRDSLSPQIKKSWEARIAGRITQRLIKNLREEKGHPRHPEALLPRPEYMIVMEVTDVVDLTPHNLKGEL
jgi:uncharacterized pyridoxamine 5'-phosphate oxidase family protein